MELNNDKYYEAIYTVNMYTKPKPRNVEIVVS